MLTWKGSCVRFQNPDLAVTNPFLSRQTLPATPRKGKGSGDKITPCRAEPTVCDVGLQFAVPHRLWSSGQGLGILRGGGPVMAVEQQGSLPVSTPPEKALCRQAPEVSAKRGKFL